MFNVVVAGATGRQGGAVVRALLRHNAQAGKSDKIFHVRALTRNTTSAAAVALQDFAAKKEWLTLVKCDLVNRTDVDSAMVGADAVFGVTNYWEPSGESKTEEQQGMNLVDAAIAAKVKHFVWSSLPNVDKISNNTIHVDDYMNKANVEDHLRATAPESMEVSIIMMGYFFENFIRYTPALTMGGKWLIAAGTKPDVKVAWIDTNDLGDVITAILIKGKGSKKAIKVASEWLTFQEVSDLFTQHGQPTEYAYVPPSRLGTALSKDLARMFHFYNTFGYYGDGLEKTQDPEYHQKTVKLAHKLNPNMNTASNWVRDELQKGSIKPSNRLEGLGISALSNCSIL